MFQLIPTIFKKMDENAFYVTPIVGADGKKYFLPSELEEQLGYEDLPNIIGHSSWFREGTHYEIFKGDALKSLKEMMLQRWSSRTPSPISSFAQSAMLFTEPGLWSLLARSNKPAARPLQDFMFVEVMPKISSTGSYSIAGNKLKERRNDLRDALEIIKSYKRIGKFYGVAPINVQKETLKEIKELSGLDFSKVFSLFPLEIEEKKTAVKVLNKEPFDDTDGVYSYICSLFEETSTYDRIEDAKLEAGVTISDLYKDFSKYKKTFLNQWAFSRVLMKQINNRVYPDDKKLYIFKKRTSKCNKVCIEVIKWRKTNEHNKLFCVR